MELVIGNQLQKYQLQLPTTLCSNCPITITITSNQLQLITITNYHYNITDVHTSAILQSSPSLYNQLSNYVTYIHMPAIHCLEELLVLWFNTKGYERAVHKVSPISPPRHSLTSSLPATVTKQLHWNPIRWVPIWHPMWSKILSSLIICLVISMLLTTLFLYTQFSWQNDFYQWFHDSTIWTHKVDVDTLLQCSIMCQWIWWWLCVSGYDDVR